MATDVSQSIVYALRRGLQIQPEAVDVLKQVDTNELDRVIKAAVNQSIEQNSNIITKTGLELLLGIQEDPTLENEHEIILDPTPHITSAEGIDGFSKLFTSRFQKLRSIISERPDAKKIKNINSFDVGELKEATVVCGLVDECVGDERMKLVIEDLTGSIEISVFKSDVQDVAKKLVRDQFVMVRIMPNKNGGCVAKEIIYPDIPKHKQNFSKTDAYAMFLSDLHIGSKFFMEEELRNCVKWLSGNDPIALRVRFLLICGDVVDGVGVYKDQDKDLVCLTLEKQLEKAYDILKDIPERVKVFIAPGNHDPGRRALPQPAIPEKYNQMLWKRENFFMIGNPALVSLNGVKVLMYHGQGIDDIVRVSPGLDYSSPADVMEVLLKTRHLSPIYGGQTPLAPETQDMLVIEDIPDIFHTGHVHVGEFGRYRGVLMINSGTWQKQTPFQAGAGITPTTNLAVFVNLKTFDVRVLSDFK